MDGGSRRCNAICIVIEPVSQLLTPDRRFGVREGGGKGTLIPLLACAPYAASTRVMRYLSLTASSDRKRLMNIARGHKHAHKITIKSRRGLKNDFCPGAHAAAAARRERANIIFAENYDSMFKSTLVYLYASMSNQYYTYIFTSEFTSKPPISRRPHIHIPARNRYRWCVPGFDFRSLFIHLFFPFY